MFRIRSIFDKFYRLIKTVSKKLYRTGVVLLSGSFVIALVAFNSNDYSGGGKNNATTAYVTMYTDIDEEEKTDEDLTVLVETDTKEIESITQEHNGNVLDKEKLNHNNVKHNYVENEPDNSILDDKDYHTLLRIVEAEATGEDLVGKILVANVVLNRVESSRFPDNVTDVVFQKNGSVFQFSPIKDGRYHTVVIQDSTIEAVERALSGEDYSKGALYFTASKNPGNWFNQSLQFLFAHGGHSFYTN